MDGDFYYQDGVVKTHLTGKALLTIPQLNKGTAFSHEEREVFDLTGKLPDRVESIEEQCVRAYQQYQRFEKDFEKFIFLASLQSYNQTLYFYLIKRHLREMIPLVYTPLISHGVINFSTEFRATRGLYVSYANRNKIKQILRHRTNKDVSLIVVSDGESILGIGDQGIGGLVISVAKLAIYSIFGAVDPSKTLPVVLDVGTNNEALLEDDMYLGARHKRLSGSQYDELIQLFVSAVKEIIPDAFLHWEDFGRNNAERILTRYQGEICSFNDDSQGTAVVTLSAIFSGLKHQGKSLSDSRFVVFGAGTAGVGIARYLVKAMVVAGLTESEAYDHIYLIDREGLITHKTQQVTEEQLPFIKQSASLTLQDTLTESKASILIGTSAACGSFTQDVVEIMCGYTQHPMILILSNPHDKMEARPEDVIRWSDGRALVVSGSPSDDVVYHGRRFIISQCNNFLIFPGIGLAAVVAKLSQLTDDMLLLASDVVSHFCPKVQESGLLPSIDQHKEITTAIATAIVEYAIEHGYAKSQLNKATVIQSVEQSYWEPRYYPYQLDG